MPINDEFFQNLSTVQSNQNSPGPYTVASAADMASLITQFLTFVTGTTPIATIQPIVSGVHMIVLIFTNGNPGGVTTGGNIATAVDPDQNAPVFLFWNPITSTWRAGKLAVG